MADKKMALLTDRGIVRVTGEDGEKLLQGVITNDMARLGSAPALFAGLLTPQGKILFDFFVVKDVNGFRLEAARERVPELVQRLLMYKLRARVDIRDASADYTVAAFWGGAAPPGDEPATLSFPDPRLPDLGHRAHVPMPYDWMLGSSRATAVSAADYHAHRIALGVPEGGKDYPFGDTFPHEALFDQLGGVSFEKGCYVGQEIVARMEHRGTARKRIVPVVSLEPLPASGTEVKAGEAVIGNLGSSAGHAGLALVRLDRVAEARQKSEPLAAAGILLQVALPPWARFQIN